MVGNRAAFAASSDEDDRLRLLEASYPAGKEEAYRTSGKRVRYDDVSTSRDRDLFAIDELLDGSRAVDVVREHSLSIHAQSGMHLESEIDRNSAL